MRQRLLNIIGGVVGLLALIGVAVALALTLSHQATIPEPTATLAQAFKKPTPTATVTSGSGFDSPIKTPTSLFPPVPWPTAPPYTPPPGWEDVALEQIHFGEPTVALTHTGRIKVIEWLPDNQRLLLELSTGDPVLHNRIVTLDVETGEIVEYGRRPDRDIAPVWVEQAQGVVFDFWTSDTLPELRLGRARGQVLTLDQADTWPTAHRPSGRVFYFPARAALQAMDANSRRVVSPPFQAEALPFGKLRADPQGRWLVSFWRREGEDLALADMSRGMVRWIGLNDPTQSFTESWPLDVVWSPDGQHLAVIMGWWGNLLKACKLAILEPESGDWYWLELPSQFIDEIDWAPDGRHLLVLGADLEEGEHINTFWLVDTVTGEYLRSDLLMQRTMLVPQWSVAWSENGQRLARFGGVPGGGIGILLSDVEIVR